MFAHGAPLGAHGLDWLYVHLANVWGQGVDKLSFEGRRWVQGMEGSSAGSGANTVVAPLCSAAEITVISHSTDNVLLHTAQHVCAHNLNHWLSLCCRLARPAYMRREFVRQYVSSVLQVASDPLKHTWWQDAEKPWQALAACAEIAAALQVRPDLVWTDPYRDSV